MAKDKNKKVTAKVVDFSKVKDRVFNTKRLPEGDYPARVKAVSDHTSKAGNFQWLFEIEITGNANGSTGAKGAVYPYYCGTGADELWKVRNLFIACGMNVPKKKMSVDPSKAVGKALGVSLEDDEYDGKPKSVINGTIPLSEIVESDGDEGDGDEDAEDETPPSSVKTKEKKGKKSKGDDAEEAPAKAGKKDKAGKKGKKSKGTVTEDELEELEVDEL